MHTNGVIDLDLVFLITINIDVENAKCHNGNCRLPFAIMYVNAW